MKTLNAFVLLIASAAAAAVAAPPTMAANGSSPTTSHAVNKAHAKKAPANAAHDDEEKTPDIAGSQPTDYRCELGNSLTIYQNASDDQQIALRWHKHLYQLTRVTTTTGAQRFENAKKGLVWIGIPAKGMLLDSKKGQQLANECKSPEQPHTVKADSKG